MALLTEYTNIKRASVHIVGNMLREEGVRFSPCELELEGTSHQIEREMMLRWTADVFKADTFCNLYHEADIKLNEVHYFVGQIFEDPENFHRYSEALARLLYEKSNYPKVKCGEFVVIYFSDVIFEGETVDAVGLFKSEKKDPILKMNRVGDGFELQVEYGININQLDKGCLILNIEHEDGYAVAVVDNTSKGANAHYWIDDFLHVRQRNDDKLKTQQALSLCKSFVTQALPGQFDVTKADQDEYLNQSLKFCDEKDTFNMKEFAHEVLQQPNLIEAFDEFKKEWESSYCTKIEDDFTISDSVVKKARKVFKSVIKLDKNFHIYVHGNNQLIKKGYDPEAEMHYYQLLFKSEQ